MKKVIITSVVAVVIVTTFANISYAESMNNPVQSITKKLSLGTTDDQVSLLQQVLKELGYFNYSKLTRYFGLITKKSVISFQETTGITPDGIVGPITRSYLDTYYKKIHTVTPGVSQSTSSTSETIWLPRKGGVTESGGQQSNTASDTIPPTVSITTPVDSTPFSSTNIIFQSNATDNVGVVGVQYQVDGLNVGAEQTVAPYMLQWNDGAATQGPHIVTATARDAAGNTTTSAPVTYYIDTTAPTVTITSPSSATITNNPTQLSADVTDNQGFQTVVANVYDAVPPNNLVYTHIFNAAPYSINWNNGVPDGNYLVEFIATDFAGNVGSATKAIAITASPTTYNLIINKAGTGSGMVISTPAGINCGATCVAAYDAGSMVTLTAAPAMGSVFTGWSGVCSGTASCTVSIDQEKNVTATFDAI